MPLKKIRGLVLLLLVLVMVFQSAVVSSSAYSSLMNQSDLESGFYIQSAQSYTISLYKSKKTLGASAMLWQQIKAAVPAALLLFAAFVYKMHKRELNWQVERKDILIPWYYHGSKYKDKPLFL